MLHFHKKMQKKKVNIMNRVVATIRNTNFSAFLIPYANHIDL